MYSLTGCYHSILQTIKQDHVWRIFWIVIPWNCQPSICTLNKQGSDETFVFMWCVCTCKIDSFGTYLFESVHRGTIGEIFTGGERMVLNMQLSINYVLGCLKKFHCIGPSSNLLGLTNGANTLALITYCQRPISGRVWLSDGCFGL
jgi:hypothetical protein